MKPFSVAILGCGTVGSGVVKILLDMGKVLSDRSSRAIELREIVDLLPGRILKSITFHSTSSAAAERI